MDMPDKLYLGPECVKINDKAYLACWLNQHEGYKAYTRTDIAQSLADALELLIHESMASDFNEHWDSYKDAIAALANYRKGE